MTQYDVKGMNCAACSSRVEKAVSALDGVTSCSVSLLTNSMAVEGSAPESEVIAAVQKAGYSAQPKQPGGAAAVAKDRGSDSDTETPKILKRLIASVIFLLVLMYFSMGQTMLSLPLPQFFSGNYAALGIIQMLLAAIVMVINQRFFISGFRGLVHRAPNMDTLVALGSGVSFCYSVCVLLMITSAQLAGDDAHMLFHELYFESSAMILTLITVGKLLEAHSKGKTTSALKSLMKLLGEICYKEV